MVRHPTLSCHKHLGRLCRRPPGVGSANGLPAHINPYRAHVGERSLQPPLTRLGPAHALSFLLMLRAGA
ncbi:hypothetical protein EU767_14540 [Mycobacterium tuberculosis]|nr:hypothetical protein EU767_14540 [Mycobacterium tuberculosis]